MRRFEQRISLPQSMHWKAFMKRMALLAALLAVVVTVTLFVPKLHNKGQILNKDQVLTFDGLGPVRLGMTRADAEAALGVKLKSLYPNPQDGCWFANRADGIDGAISYWIEKGRIVRIDIDEYAWPKSERAVPGVATDRGISIDSSTDDVKRAYGSRLKIDFHPQGDAGDENYLYVALPSEDERYGMLFEIWEGKVKSFWMGTAEAYESSEPCI